MKVRTYHSHGFQILSLMLVSMLYLGLGNPSVTWMPTWHHFFGGEVWDLYATKCMLNTLTSQFKRCCYLNSRVGGSPWIACAGMEGSKLHLRRWQIVANDQLSCLQMIVEKSKQLDYRRVASMTFLGFALVGPLLHYWYMLILVTILKCQIHYNRVRTSIFWRP
jgi:hypothetical protein